MCGPFWHPGLAAVPGRAYAPLMPSSPTRIAWRRMRDSGVTLSPAFADYDRFLGEMGEAPGEGAQVERIDERRPYSVTNARWSKPRAKKAKAA